MTSKNAATTSTDPAYKYGIKDPNNRTYFTCIFCRKVTKGGVHRLKQHFVGGFRNVIKCPSCPENVRQEISEFMLKKATSKTKSQMLPKVPIESQSDDGLDEDEEEFVPKKPRTKGLMDMVITPRTHPEKDEKAIYKVIDETLREKTYRSIARFFCDAGIPINAVSYPSFGKICESIAQYGPGLKIPTMYELKVSLIGEEVNDTQMQLHRSLHATADFLNPSLNYGKPDSSCEEVMKSVFKCIEMLSRTVEMEGNIIRELRTYISAGGLFGLPVATKLRNTQSPAEWWSSFGTLTPSLQKFALKIFRLTYNATAEKNLDVVQHIDKNKRNVERWYKRKYRRDPLLLEEIDESSEWLIGRMEDDSSDDNDDDNCLTWSPIRRITKAYDSHMSKEKGIENDSTLPEEEEEEEDIGEDDDCWEDDEYYDDDDEY
ncbi:PREDICTED: uncharacterized protein LOC104820419 [Tarenaya hassleriana]|uniref:uncharacterized protein LOC104820419 n=1 Tax=Tarenaya hassleriana TaxID=28532 RepID=UPI00053C9B0A|nr:PREDICTED: uncharacterized protein LOC104820419 [Tarenaya hassleriana]